MKNPAARLLRLLAPRFRWMFLGALLGFFTVGSGVGLLMLAAWLISTAALHPGIAELQVAVVGVRFFGIMRSVWRYVERLVTHQVTFKILADLRSWFFRQLIPLVPGRLGGLRSADLFVRLTADIDTLEQFYLRVLTPPATAALTALLLTLLFLRISPAAALIQLLFFLGAATLVPWLARFLGKKYAAQLVVLRNDLHNLVVDGLQGMAELRLFGARERHLEQVSRLNSQLEMLHRKSARLAGFHSSLLDVFMYASVASVLAVVLPQVLAGRLSGVLPAVLALGVMASFEALQPLPQALQELESSLEAARRLFSLIPDEVSTPSFLPGKSLPDLRRLDFLRVGFTYPDNAEQALHDCSWNLRRGEQVAVVGPSGAGKSTMLQMILGFLQPQTGQLTWNGIPYPLLEAEEIRKHLGVVSHRDHIFHTTLRENLLLGNPDATEEELQKSLKAAGLWELVEKLPRGLDTVTGESGTRLSGGERQRLLIARVLLRNPEILLLDEPTANLDVETERRLLETLLPVTKGRTVLWITHRLVRMEQMDWIIVLQKGTVVEQGKHQQLLSQKGLYRKLWDSQNDLLPA